MTLIGAFLQVFILMGDRQSGGEHVFLIISYQFNYYSSKIIIIIQTQRWALMYQMILVGMKRYSISRPLDYNYAWSTECLFFRTGISNAAFVYQCCTEHAINIYN